MAHALPALPVAPVPPDLYVCDATYGTNILVADCTLAVADFQRRYPLFAYAPQNFPLIASAGTCYITVELGGPSAPPVVPISMGDRRSIIMLANVLVRQCLVMTNGVGGFVTYGLLGLVDYSLQIPSNYFDNPFPPTAYFLTVTLSGSSKRFKPGDTDPAIPLVLSSFQNAWVRAHPSLRSSDAYRGYELNAAIWKAQALKSIRGGSETWYDFQTGDSNAMNYECDAGLGSPSEVDCTQIEWHQLHPASDTLTVGPTATTFFHSNTCYLAISATVALVLSWAQIRTALSALMTVCVQHPVQGPQGGRAYFTPPHKISGGRKRDTKLTGLNALPPHANITIFQQLEPWVNPSAELESCTWKAVTNGHAITACHRG